jgi:hypothetical protein
VSFAPRQARLRKQGWGNKVWRVGGNLTQRDLSRLRRIAEPGGGASLIRYANLGIGLCFTQRNGNVEVVFIDFRIAEEFVMMSDPFWQNKRGKCGIFGDDVDFLTIKIVAVTNLPVQGEIRAFLRKIEGKRLIDGVLDPPKNEAWLAVGKKVRLHSSRQQSWKNFLRNG